MKTAVLAVLFFFAISTALPSATAFDVFDTEGSLVQNGGSYYILSETSRGLELAQLSNDSNPVSVIQSTTASNGFPLSLSSPLRILYLSTSYFLNINFVGIDNSYWEILGGLVKVNKLRQLNGPFKLEAYNYKKGLYKILYYDSDDKTFTPLRVSSTSDAYLNMNEGDLLIVKFKKASEGSSLMSII